MGSPKPSRQRPDFESSSQEAQFIRAIADCSPDLIAAKGPDLRLRYCNRAFLATVNREDGQLLGRLESETGWIAEGRPSNGHDDEQERTREDGEALEGKTVFVPSRAYRVGGETRYFDATRSPIRGSSGEVMGVLCIWHDVTTFHTAVEELREAAERYRAMSEYSFEWEVWQDAQGRILYMSPSFARITGYPAPDFLANPELIASIVHPEDRPRYAEHRKTIVADPGRPAEPVLVFRIVRPDGEARWIEHNCRSVFRNDGSFLGRRASNRDITETKRAEERLKASEQKFRLVFENSPLGKSVTTVDGHLEVNHAFCTLLGYSEEELARKSWRDITHPDDITATEQAIAPLLAGTATVARFEKRYLHKSGEAVAVEVITALQRDDQGAPLFFITTITEFSGRRQPASG